MKRPLLDLKRSINWLDEETTGKNTNARRTIVLLDRALAILDEQEAMLKAMGIVSPWIFPDEYGQRCSPRRLYATGGLIVSSMVFFVIYTNYATQ